MHTALVGCTGFVGGNLAAHRAFDGLYHSKNIESAFGTNPDLLVYAGVPAAKFLANTDAQGDAAVCKNALLNIEKINPKKLVLISTVDVYAQPNGADEKTPADFNNPAAYGRNRAQLEADVRAAYPDALIVRLPGLFGCGLKKNFIYDFLTITPSMLKNEKYAALAEKSALVKEAYQPAENGFYKLHTPSAALRAWFAENDFNALSFTDSRASYQFYDLSNLWQDISTALAADLQLLNIATEPVSAAEVYGALTHGGVFCNEISAAPAAYDMRSQYDALYHGENGYLYTKQMVLDALCAYVSAVKKTGGNA